MPDPSSSRGHIDDDAIALLLTDHDELAELFDRYDALATDGAPVEEREELAQELCSLLLVHAVLKEEMFYPAVREAIEQDDLVDEALVALEGVRSLVDEIQAGDPTEPAYDSSVKVLHELVAQHFEEERAELFPLLRETSLDLEELGAEMSARQELLLTADE